MLIGGEDSHYPSHGDHMGGEMMMGHHMGGGMHMGQVAEEWPDHIDEN
jgi:hypothetical protein